MIKKIPYSFITFLLALLCFMPLAAQAAKKVKITGSEIRNNTLLIKHDSYGDLKFRKRVYDFPPRFVFDILDADLEPKPHNLKVPNPEMKEIRVGQFDPETVRIVIEANRISDLEKIKIENIGQTIYFQLGVKDIVIESHEFDDGNLILRADSPITFRKIELDNPERLVVDFIGAKLKDSNLKKTIDNGDEQIKIAQFDKSIVRVVFTGKKTHRRDIKISEDQKQLLVEGKDRREKKPEKKELEDKLYGLHLMSSKDDQTSIFMVKATKKLDYKFLKLHNPERFVIDLFDIEFEEELTATQFKETKHVKDVRFGLASLGKPVTRIVFDLKENNLVEDFKMSADETELTLYIEESHEDKRDADMPKAYKSAGRKVVLDAGHGGYDPGAIYGNQNEKDVTMSITDKVKKYLEESGIQTYLTRSEDRFVSLAERVEISNSINPAIFVSIHANALITNPKMDGLQTYYYSTAGYKLASVTHNQMLSDVGMPDRKVRRAAFWVCKHTKAPSILIETGFMTNDAERRKLVSDSYQTKLAKSIARGIIKYLETNTH